MRIHDIHNGKTNNLNDKIRNKNFKFNFKIWNKKNIKFDFLNNA